MVPLLHMLWCAGPAARAIRHCTAFEFQCACLPCRRRPTAAPAAARLPPRRRAPVAIRPLVACSATAAAPKLKLDTSIRRTMLYTGALLNLPATVRGGEEPAGPWQHLTPDELRWLDGEVAQLAADPSTTPGADATAQLSLPGVAGVGSALPRVARGWPFSAPVSLSPGRLADPAARPCLPCAPPADAAVIIRIGRVFPGMWKYRNQDAFVAAPAGPAALLLGVFDGHNTGGERASAAAAASVAATFADQPLPAAASPAQQQAAAVAALQHAAAKLRAAGGYKRCGTAAAVCLAAPGCLTVAWAGDCRAVAGVCMDDGSLQPLALTQDHKPDRWGAREVVGGIAG